MIFGQSIPVVKSIRDDSAIYARVIRPPIILFNLDKYNLGHPSNPLDSIKVIADFLKKHQNITIEISYHTDYRLSPYYSQKFSYQRAKTIVTALIEEFSIHPERVVPAGYENSSPLLLERPLTTLSGKIIPAGTKLTDQ